MTPSDALDAVFPDLEPELGEAFFEAHKRLCKSPHYEALGRMALAIHEAKTAVEWRGKAA